MGDRSGELKPQYFEHQRVQVLDNAENYLASVIRESIGFKPQPLERVEPVADRVEDYKPEQTVEYTSEYPALSLEQTREMVRRITESQGQ